MAQPSKTKRPQADEIEAALGGKGRDNAQPKTGEGQLTSLAGFPILNVDKMDRYVNILIYGEPGTGKTVLAGSADEVAEMSPVLLIDIEGGTMSLNDFYPNVSVLRAERWADLQSVYAELYKGKSGFKTVIVDSLTEAQKFSMQDIMRKAVREDNNVDPDVPRMRDWGKNVEQMRRFTRGFRDLPMNVIFTALVDSDKDNRGKTTVRPMFQGKIKSEVPGFMDIVGYYYVKEHGEDQKRLLLTQRTDTAIAKDRSNKLPQVMENPTMRSIYDIIVGSKS